MRKLLAILILLSFHQTLNATVADSIEASDKYNKAFEQNFRSSLSEMSGDSPERMRKYLARPDLTEEQKYLLKRELSLGLTDSTRELEQSCREVTIREDDYLWAAHCLEFGSLPLTEKRSKLEALFQTAILNHNGTATASRIGARLLDLLWAQNDIAAARLVYKTSLDILPKNALETLAFLKWSLANVYTVPGNSRKTIAEGLDLYIELERIYRSDTDSKDTADLLLYNIGDTKFTSFSDYRGALQEFQKLAPGFQYWIDSRIFSALSLIQLGKPMDARTILDNIDFKDYPMANRIPFLKCYRDIAVQALGDGGDLRSCVNLPADSQLDVIMHITSELSRKNLTTQTEILLWRQFWKFYTSKIIPQLQSHSDQQVDAMELQRAKVESQFKDLELKYFSLLKILFGVSIGGLIFILFFFIRLKKESDKSKKLQTYIHKSVLARFLPPVIVEEIIQGKSRIESKPREEFITVLFSDMVGFTALSGQLGAPSIADILNRFMQKMTEVIYRHHGTVDKFMGDAVMVLFGAPLPMPEKKQVETAILCAQDMILAMGELNLEFHRNFGVTVDIRIGINQGPAIVGTFGGAKRSDYTAIGPTVNLASRIESTANPHGIMFSAQVAKHLPEEAFESRGLFKLKGIANEIPLFALSTDWKSQTQPITPS
ncbi:MAG TPA: adenylate/guanylate cyclase domain-containing protein [Oligoflexus sp.]|uniref:adenylate/guanylate cyclase domain-containing protein n=1 Tax=Oligoflexus sp. TaxID=1971216 RepID=UPI002D2F902D|nr:adenylate/guanylate cyclase domain-containing protein [Oligoflexus sp.]HYX39554.1 adenylate/guanylate cyclase domain-containing protein [Oligoflexus sp.]